MAIGVCLTFIGPRQAGFPQLPFRFNPPTPSHHPSEQETAKGREGEKGFKIFCGLGVDSTKRHDLRQTYVWQECGMFCELVTGAL